MYCRLRLVVVYVDSYTLWDAWSLKEIYEYVICECQCACMCMCACASTLRVESAETRVARGVIPFYSHSLTHSLTPITHTHSHSVTRSNTHPRLLVQLLHPPVREAWACLPLRTYAPSPPQGLVRLVPEAYPPTPPPAALPPARPAHPLRRAWCRPPRRASPPRRARRARLSRGSWRGWQWRARAPKGRWGES